MKKIKPLTEGKVKSQIKIYEGEMPMTQAPPPPKPPKMFGDKLPDFQHTPPPPQKIRGEEVLDRIAKDLVEKSAVKKEMVNGPAHYGGVDNPYEVIKVCEAWELDKDAYLFNVVKYVARAGKKDPQKELEDLKKAAFYLDRKIKNLENETN